MDLTPANIRALRVDLHRDFIGAFDGTSTFYSDLCTTIPSNSAKNEYIWNLMSPQMREWFGSRVVQNIGAASYTIENKLWEMTIGVRRIDLEDDNLGFYGPLARQAGEAARMHPDELLVQLLQNGGSGLGFDGQYFFDTDHPVNGVDSAGGTYSNLFTSTALTAATYQTVRASMISYRGQNGKNLKVMPNLLIVPPALEVAARTIVDVQINAAGAGNINYNTAKVLMIPELAGQDTTWYLMSTQRALKPFIFQTRRPLTFVLKNQVTDEVVLQENEVRFYADARYNLGYALPFLAAKAVA